MDDHDVYVYSAILLLALCSVITRSGFMLFGDYIPLPASMRRALRYAPVAALTAIVVPDFLPWQAGLGPVFDYKLVAALLGIIVFLRTRSAVLVIVVGMLALWGLRWLAEQRGAGPARPSPDALSDPVRASLRGCAKIKLSTAIRASRNPFCSFPRGPGICPSR
ncbi:hypothetical protein BTL50_13270 [Bordetella holmesii]|nr:branched-chain amino acid transporter [Bordetella holmesii F627]AUL23637.1 hypothetical protein BTL48_13210 [Bordetella holmesii]AUL26963.1 hypothetical protein BTL49_13285 [Bordetella holmesii]AUL30308.1 hypothetical protein BTL50_13270 [Bordetella holmesii]AUL33632.1 hypothetical protein BTL51_13270 [Bordetella holmesii]